jgi:hypothetical protein
MGFIKLLLAGVGLFVLIAIIAGVVGVSSGSSGTSIRRGLEHEGSREIAADLIDQYEFLVKNGGSYIERCTQAGAVAYAYMSANDADGYKQWRDTERRECNAAGIPMPEAPRSASAPAAPVPCGTSMNSGHCMPVSSCPGAILKNLCPGDDSIACCIGQ